MWLLEERTILSYSAGAGEEETKHWRPLPTCGRSLRRRQGRPAGLEGEAGLLVSVRLPGAGLPWVV